MPLSSAIARRTDEPVEEEAEVDIDKEEEGFDAVFEVVGMEHGAEEPVVGLELACEFLLLWRVELAHAVEVGVEEESDEGIEPRATDFVHRMASYKIEQAVVDEEEILAISDTETAHDVAVRAPVVVIDHFVEGAAGACKEEDAGLELAVFIKDAGIEREAIGVHKFAPIDSKLCWDGE